MTLILENPWLGIALVAFCMAGLMTALECYQYIRHPDPEWVRKLMHIGGGLVALSFPWIFHHTWPVLVLVAMTLVQFYLIRYGKGFQTRFDSVIGSVGRNSMGEFYFPPGVLLLFCLADGNPVLYTAPLLSLIFADAVAALVGTRYGKLRFSTAEGQKSIEGSTAFFVVAFFCIQIPLLFLNDQPLIASPLVAGSVALLLTVAEAFSCRGADNFVIPILGYFLLQTFTKMAAPEELIGLTLSLLVSFTFFWQTLLDRPIRFEKSKGRNFKQRTSNLESVL